MLIKTLKMENFRQFRGKTQVDFSLDPEKNVTIILGDNTFGKTTLLQAFNWCFYGKVNFDQRPDFLLNYEVSEEMRNGDQQKVEVEITVLHDGIEYIITRSQRYNCNSGNVRGEAVDALQRRRHCPSEAADDNRRNRDVGHNSTGNNGEKTADRAGSTIQDSAAAGS